MRKSKNEQIALLAAQFLSVQNNARFDEINKHTSKEAELERICGAMRAVLDVKKTIYDDVNEYDEGCYVYENMNGEIVIEYYLEGGESAGSATIPKEDFE
jgi:hypothetical protein